MSQSSSDRQKTPQPSYGRRHFLKESVVSIGVAVHEYVTHRDASTTKEETKPEARTHWLRPPGAVEEELFLDRCTSCGDCVKVCPSESIHHADHDETPAIYPDETPCYLCKDFPCISACETEALLPVERVDQVNMGLAVVAHRDCTAEQGCNACVSQCPTHALMMDFATFRLQVDEAQCVGCGICEHICKTVNDKIAIKVVPAGHTALPS